jgi:hypothetical protein
MSADSTRVCTHQRGPGTTVCLRCRHEERVAQRTAAARMLITAGIVVGIVAVGVSLLAWGAPELRARLLAFGTGSDSGAAVAKAGETVSASASISSVDTQATPKPAATSTPVVAPRGRGDEATPPAVAAPVPAGVAGASPPGATSDSRMILPPGRTQLSDTVFAVRSGSEVRVHFDTGFGRTRRPEKFELMLRMTLPRVYGAVADSALRMATDGFVARAGDLTEALPTSGIQLPLSGGHAITVWPETRLGRDGPLVVSYRTTIR